MIAFEITLNIFYLAGIGLVCFLSGFLVRGGQLKVFRKKITELEREMLSNHASILELQKEKAQLNMQIKESRIPVIAINSSKEDSDKFNASQARGKK